MSGELSYSAERILRVVHLSQDGCPVVVGNLISLKCLSSESRMCISSALAVPGDEPSTCRVLPRVNRGQGSSAPVLKHKQPLERLLLKDVTSHKNVGQTLQNIYVNK